MDFKQITLSDVGALRPYLRAQYRSCDYSVLGVFMWADRFGYEYKTEDGVLFMRERSRHGGEYDYLLPTGEGSLCDRVRALRETVGAGLTMSLVPEDALGAIYLGIIAIVPILISHFSTSASLSGISLGGTSIIIVVGVALETVRALEAQMLMRNYKGFLS